MNLPSKYSFIELNPELEKILNIIQNTNENLCVLGAAGCLTGDTIIRASRARRGFRMPLEELYKKFNSIEGGWDSSFSTYARSYDEEANQIKLNEITDVFESGVKPIFELILEDGSNLRGTYDHKVMTVEGWKELGELTSKDFVLVDKTTRWSKSGRITIEQKRKAKMKYNDKKISIGLFYPNKRVNRYTRTRERVPKYVGVEHILTYEAYINNVAIDDIVNASYDSKLASKYKYINTNTHAVHHKDGNHKNNAISNLECISHHEHLR
ncbi:MAG TPA: HNH endonuclease, partial [Tissierellaceae bacterium]|nr:HNH endonuclease [Tissierellaceae bacterium]